MIENMAQAIEQAGIQIERDEANPARFRITTANQTYIVHEQAIDVISYQVANKDGSINVELFIQLCEENAE